MIKRDLEIGWIAGFLDGDGCFGWYGEKRSNRVKQRKKWVGYPLVTATQIDIEPLERISKRFPGKIRLAYEGPKRKTCYSYYVTNKIAIDIMVEVFPLMSVRRQNTIKEVVANYASREAERITEALYCPKGHPRSEFGFKVKSGVRKGNKVCKQCNKEWVSNGKVNKEISTIYKELGIS